MTLKPVQLRKYFFLQGKLVDSRNANLQCSLINIELGSKISVKYIYDSF